MVSESSKNMALNPQAKSFLQALFRKFEDENIKYCVLHSYEKILDEPVGDIDFAIDYNGLINLWNIIDELSHLNGLIPVQKTYHDVPFAHKFIIYIPSDKDQVLALDFVHDEKGINACLFNTNEILYNRIKYNGLYYISAKTHEFIYYLIKKIHKGYVEKNKIEHLKNLYLDNQANCQEILIKYFGERNSQLLVKILLQDIKEPSEIKYIFNKLKKSLWLRQFILNPQKGIIWSFLSGKRISHRTIHPQGLSISFISPDGGGKTTLAEEITHAIGWAFDGRIQRLHWRPGLLPFPYRLLKPKEWKEPEPVKTDPHGGPAQSGFLSLCRFLYYTADYLLGFVPKILWPKIRFNLVILDRYYYDFLIDRRRFNLNIPEILPRLFLPLIPKPDMVFLLTGDPGEIYQRKKELPLEEIERQIIDIKKLARKLPNAYEINASQPLEKVVEEVKEIIINYLADRLRRREEEKSWWMLG